MNKYIKFICISILTILLCFTFINDSYAAPTHSTTQTDGGGGGTSSQSTSNDPIVNPDFYKPTDKGGNDQLIDLGNTIIGALQLLGTIAAVITIMVIGLRYMFASVAERASYKETMVPYLIGAIMLFAIPNILQVIYDLIKGLNL